MRIWRQKLFDDEDVELAVDWANEYSGKRAVYHDFATIDWIHDFAKDRIRTKRLYSRPGMRGMLWRLWDSSLAWLVLSAVGTLAGLVSGFLTIASSWLSDLKLGYCSSHFFLDKKFCCWETTGKGLLHGRKVFNNGTSSFCPDWVEWSTSASNSVDVKGFLIYSSMGVTLATLSAVLVVRLAPYAAGSGIPEMKCIMGGFIIRKFLGFRTLLVKSLGLVFSVASGLCLGKEGPMVHVAACIGNIIPRCFEKFAANEAKRREILSASSAAGVSVAFGSPISGVLFSLEEISYYFPIKTLWRSFVCAALAALSLQSLNPFRTGKLVIFQTRFPDKPMYFFEILPVLLLGLLGGIIGSLINHLNIKVMTLRKYSWLRKHPILQVFILAVLTSCLNYPFLASRMDLSQLIENLFQTCDPDKSQNIFCTSETQNVIISLVYVLIFKIFLTVVTYGAAIPCGIFVPSIAIGASLGRLVGVLMEAAYFSHRDSSFFSACQGNEFCVVPGFYAVVGAASVLTGVTRMTVTTAVIMFEITGELSNILPLMLSVMVSKFVGDSVYASSISESLIRLKGFPYLSQCQDYKFFTTAASIMTDVSDLNIISASNCTVETVSNLAKEDYSGFPIVNNLQDLILMGYISLEELNYALEKERRTRNIEPSDYCLFFDTNTFDSGGNTVNFLPYTDKCPIMVSEKISGEVVVELFRRLGVRYIVVADQGILKGLITKKDILRFLAQNNK